MSQSQENKSKKKKPKNQIQNWQLPEKRLTEIQHNITVIIAKLGPLYRFGHYELEDLETSALIWINNKYHLYDENRKLFNYMYTIIKHELYNLKRKEFSRISPPCVKCPLNAYKNKKCLLYEELSDCKYYATWLSINKRKEELSSVYQAADSKDTSTVNPLSQLVNDEQLKAIAKHLSPKHQETLQKVMENEKVNKVRFDNLIAECKWILQNPPVDDDE